MSGCGRRTTSRVFTTDTISLSMNQAAPISIIWYTDP